MMNYEDLMKKAKEVSANSYSPYSKFAVGACVLMESGNAYQGCNFESSSYGMTICAERNAIGTAIANGGVVNDHHGVGMKLGRLMKEQYGPAMQVFEGLKKSLDPNGIMNPFKLGL